MDHFVIFLLGSEKILQHIDQIWRCNHLRNILSSANGWDKHDTLQNYIIFGESIYKIVMNELDKVSFLDNFFPVIGRNIDHGS